MLFDNLSFKLLQQFGKYLTEKTIVDHWGFRFIALTHTGVYIPEEIFVDGRSLLAVIGLLFPFQGCEGG
jgi:hypothetical protein